VISTNYVESSEVASFVSFLESIVNGKEGSFVHEYQSSKPKKLFRFSSFKEAFFNYEWMNTNYESNAKQLAMLNNQLVGAMHSEDELQCLVAALKILEWGEVYRGSVGWLAAKAEKGILVKSIKEARDILSSDNHDNIYRFVKGKEALRSDSGMTKIYALAGGKSIIYDDRVGAALALLVKLYLQKEGIFHVPESLQFMCKSKDRSGRNPSEGTLKFPGKDTGMNHALSNLRANRIIEAIATDTNNFGNWEDQSSLATESDRMRAIESALFMIGYAVHGDRVVTTYLE